MTGEINRAGRSEAGVAPLAGTPAAIPIQDVSLHIVLEQRPEGGVQIGANRNIAAAAGIVGHELIQDRLRRSIRRIEH